MYPESAGKSTKPVLTCPAMEGQRYEVVEGQIQGGRRMHIHDGEKLVLQLDSFVDLSEKKRLELKVLLVRFCSAKVGIWARSTNDKNPAPGSRGCETQGDRRGAQLRVPECETNLLACPAPMQSSIYRSPSRSFRLVWRTQREGVNRQAEVTGRLCSARSPYAHNKVQFSRVTLT